MLENSRNILIASILVGLIAGISLTVMLPSNTPYSIANTGPTGLSKLAVYLKAEPIRTGIGSIPGNPRESAVIIIQQGRPSPIVVKTIHKFAVDGGLVIVSGDYYFINYLIRYENLTVSVTNYPIYDPIINAGDRYHPILIGTNCSQDMIGYKPLQLTPSGGLEVVARTSMYSYADENLNGYLDLTENISSYVVGVKAPLGRGYLIVLTSPASFTNQYIDNNIAFIKCLVEGRNVYIDQSQQSNNILEVLKISLKYGPAGILRTSIIMLSIISGVISYIIIRKYYK